MKLNAPDYYKVREVRKLYGIKKQPFPKEALPDPKEKDMRNFIVVQGLGPNYKVNWFKTFESAYNYAYKKGEFPWIIAQILMWGKKWKKYQ